MPLSSCHRKKILHVRDALSASDRHSISRDIASRVLLLEEIQRKRTFFIYVNFRSEVKTDSLITEFLRLGRQVVVPVTCVTGKKLLPVHITDLEKDLEPGYCSIPEPRMQLRAQQKVDGGQIDVIILPGSVFDVRGGRLGYGGGYYDRFLAVDAPQALRIGLAFDFQVVDRLSLQSHDQLLDLVVTEKRIIHGVR